jgi:hypothetical protein
MTCKRLLLFCVVLAFFAACKPTITTPDHGHTGPNIYVTGYGSYGDNNPTITGAVYWKNGTLVPLPGAQNATGITFSDTDVYISGNAGYALPNDGGSANEAVYWKNGTMVKLGSAPSLANAIAVSGTDVYVAGYASINDVYVAAYWKNGVLQPLAGNIAHSGANAIAISGTDVYVAGIAGDNGSIATYWKNGVEIPLETSTASSANALVISGSDVYIAGSYTNASYKKAAVYWKNGTRVSLNDASVDPDVTDTYASGIAVSGADVHVIGYIKMISGVYWKNGVQIPLGNPAQYENVTNNMNSILLSGTDVYISFNTAEYWKNGTLVPVGSGYATSMGIQEE